MEITYCGGTACPAECSHLPMSCAGHRERLYLSSGIGQTEAYVAFDHHALRTLFLIVF